MDLNEHISLESNLDKSWQSNFSSPPDQSVEFHGTMFQKKIVTKPASALLTQC